MNSIDLAARPMYRLFLQELLVVVKAVPRAQIGMVIETQFLCIDSFLVFVKSLTKSPLKGLVIALARGFLSMTWALVLAVLALFLTLSRQYLIKKLNSQKAKSKL